MENDTIKDAQNNDEQVVSPEDAQNNYEQVVTPDETPEVGSTGKSQEELRKIRSKLIMFALGVLVFLVVVILYIMMKSEGGSGGGDDDSFPIAVLVPIWTAAFIPIIANRNKKSELTEKKLKTKIAIVVGLAIMMVLGITMYLLMK